MQWNRTVGSLEVRITAVKGQARAGTVCSSYISEAAAGHVRSSDSKVGGGSSHKWVWILLAAAGAVGAGAAVAGGGKSSSSSATATPAAPSIGTPTITIGHP
jgi:hypothetical protein